MRVLFVLPHYANADPVQNPEGRVHGALGANLSPRVEALTACLTALHQQFSQSHCQIYPGRKVAERLEPQQQRSLEVVICTTRGCHLLDRLPAACHGCDSKGVRFFQHRETDAEPLLLGFACHAVLRERLGDFDYYCYLEDDLILHDPWLFIKLQWFNRHVGDDKLLQPNRYEAGLSGLAVKAYVDGDLRDTTTAEFQNVNDTPKLGADVLGQRVWFQRTKNPHSGCFFLNARQMRHWSEQPYFLEPDVRFIGPLESAASLGIMRTFKVYRPTPANADFLEVQHYGTGYLRQLCSS